MRRWLTVLSLSAFALPCAASPSQGSAVAGDTDEPAPELLEWVPATFSLGGVDSGDEPEDGNEPKQEAIPPEEPPKPSTHDLFFGEDGSFDISGFLSSRTGFLPLAIPISEPAVGYGLVVGLSYFHSEPKVVPGTEGERPRVVMPSTTVAMGAATENGTWAAGLAHLGSWNEGRIRYLGAVGYANLNLEWFGKGESLGDQSISYTNDTIFVIQNIRFKLGESDFLLGPTYRYLGSDATFFGDAVASGIPEAELESSISGVGAQLSYDSVDHPYSATRGLRADLTVNQQAEWLGGDFSYTKFQSYAIAYFPIREKAVLGLRLNGDFIEGEAPFYDLPGIIIRGLPRGKYVDDAAVYGEVELRYDFAKRWSAIGFAGAGRVASALDDFLDADTQAAGGVGFRYLIAEKYGLRLGIDLAYGDDEGTLYVTVGTGWIRP